MIVDDKLKMIPVEDDKEDGWKPRPRIVVDLSIPDGVELVLMINGVQLMPDDGSGE
jgi:hypothetical protein